jgi:hypothetical protein
VVAGGAVVVVDEVVAGTDYRQLAILITPRVLGEGEAVTGGHGAHAAIKPDDILIDLQTFEMIGGIGAAIALDNVVAGIVETFVLIVGMAERIGEGGGQIGLRAFEVVIGMLVAAGLDFAGQAPGIEVVTLGAGIGTGVEGDGRITGAVGMAGEVVGEDEGFTAGGVFEPEIDAFMFQAAADEGEVGLGQMRKSERRA